MIRLSEGTSACLGLKATRMDTYPSTAYLLSGDKCSMSCSFCPRGSGNYNNRLGRVGWPEYTEEEVAKGLVSLPQGRLQRLCLQAVRGESGIEPIIRTIDILKKVSHLPISLSAWVDNREEAGALLQAGAERISIALDAATDAVYARVKGGVFNERLGLLLSCADAWPGRFTTHLICGLGENEEDLLSLIDSLIRAGVRVALFSFTPLRGTLMEDRPQPKLESYRRVQAGFYLLRDNAVSLSALSFKDGKLLSFGLSRLELEKQLTGGKAFETTGCSGCNRPYYNERPQGPLYNYHRPLTPLEAEKEIGILLRSIEV